MSVNHKELSLVIQEANQLSSKPTLTKREERRLSTLMMFASAIKQGATLQELEIEAHNDEARTQGFDAVPLPKKSFLTREQEQEARGWQKLVEHGTKTESRDMTVGNPLSQLGTYTGLGTFVPTGFMNRVFSSLKAADFLLNEDDVTLVKTTDGRLINVPLLSDTENVATLVGGASPEGALLSEQDIAMTSHATLAAYRFKSPMFISSIESWDDVAEAATVLELFQKFASVRFALGLSAALVNGNGVNGPTGLLQQLAALGAPAVVATGSSANDGTSATGTNSLGTDDFVSAFGQLDNAYLASDKIAWAMSMPTLLKLGQVKDRYGRPVFVSDFNQGITHILGIPVKICPSLPTIGSSNTCVVLGDWNFFCTRLAIGDNGGVAVFNERYSEFGKVGFRLFAGGDGKVLWDGDQSSKSPFITIQCHS